jgi:hypothetical protein
MPYAIINKDGSEAISVGFTEAEAWENAGLEEEERANYRAVTITEESYREALADPGPEEVFGEGQVLPRGTGQKFSARGSSARDSSSARDRSVIRAKQCLFNCRPVPNPVSSPIRFLFIICKPTLPSMLRQRSGTIINISSIAAIRYTGYNYISYYAAKAAVNQFTGPREGQVNYSSKTPRARDISSTRRPCRFFRQEALIQNLVVLL